MTNRTNDTIEKQRKAFNAWFTPNVHKEKAIATLGIRGVLWVAFQVGWQKAIDDSTDMTEVCRGEVSSNGESRRNAGATPAPQSPKGISIVNIGESYKGEPKYQPQPWGIKKKKDEQ